MHHLIIDTCVWIEACKHYEILEKLLVLIDQGKARLILPEIIIEEWDRNKETKITLAKEQSIQDKIKNARAISKYLEENEANEFNRIPDQFKQREEEIKRLALEEVNLVESLFNHPSTIKLGVIEKAKLQAVDLALAKKAPFQNKNSMADALIILSAIDYIIQENLTDCMFISSNTNDFGKDGIHEDLKELFERCQLKYFSNIGQAINEIEEHLISSEIINKIERERIFVEMADEIEEVMQRWNLINVDLLNKIQEDMQKRSLINEKILNKIEEDMQQQWNLIQVDIFNFNRLHDMQKWAESYEQSVTSIITESFQQSLSRIMINTRMQDLFAEKPSEDQFNVEENNSERGDEELSEDAGDK